MIAKFTAEAAVNVGEKEAASFLLVAILRSDPDDPQALGIEAHLYGQQHDIEKRDNVISHIQKLHDSGKPAPPVAIIEREVLPDGQSVRIFD